MPNITLPDGSVRSYDGPVTAATIASDIGPGLAKAALIAVVDGHEWDLSRPIKTDAAVALVTVRDKAALIAIVDGSDWDLSRPIEADATVALVTAKDEVALAL